jgi:succinyl-diaminopimelate desuccinylase
VSQRVQPSQGAHGNQALPTPDLLDLAASLVAIPSESRSEAAIADAVEAALRLCPWLAVERIGDNVVARTSLGRSKRLMLAGHLDTVPAAGNEVPVVEDGVLRGLGAADMKGGLAVFLHVAGAIPEPTVDVTWCFYACEEIAQQFSGLGRLWEECPDLLQADAAILGEPTGGLVEAGCQGTLRITITMGGSRAHTARPFMGRNAIHRLAPVLQAVHEYQGRRPVLDGCEYAEQLQVVHVEGGVAGNVVPDRASVTINHRFAPDRKSDEAVEAIRDLLSPWLEEDDSWVVTDVQPGAPPGLDHSLLAALVEASGTPPRAKVGWTDVASFWAHGVPAANFGPGDPLLAHTPGEFVGRDELEHAAAVLASLLTAS